VITTFFTPYFIKAADPCYEIVARHLPDRLKFLLERYSAKEAESESRMLWKSIAIRHSWRTLLYASLLTAIIIFSHNYIEPLAIGWLGSRLGKLFIVTITIGAMAPFLFALASPCTRRSEYEKLSVSTNHRSDVPLVVMSLFRIILASAFILGYLHMIYTKTAVITIAVVIIVVSIFTLSRKLRKHMYSIESRFISNLNERELHRSGKEYNLVSDLHMAFMTVGYDCPFVGDRLRNSDLRKNYGINVVSISRGANYYPVPTGDMRIFPGNVAYDKSKVEFTHFELTDNSPIIGKSVAQVKLREDYAAMLVAIQRGEEFIKPTGDDIFKAHDVIWIVGDSKRLHDLK